MINPNVEVFNRDVASNDGYRYTTNISLSSQLATQRTTDIILGLDRFAGRSVIDVGCGDGFYTLRFWDQGRPQSVVGVDSAERAIELANARKGTRPIEFVVGDAHRLPYPDDSFDYVMAFHVVSVVFFAEAEVQAFCWLAATVCAPALSARRSARTTPERSTTVAATA